ncbi:unnamed protein product [Prorocentrum cordatum]|uniref:Uncharacterized protein n=1 Tax=Prorocentrum cordatum TaxID=2364126 RepID=A0ABN9W798_9DINO|nr:unnamed protein product [Polarella glacialis]
MATPAGVGGGTASQAAPPPPPAAMHVARPSSPSAPSGVPPWLQDPEPAADAAAGLSALPMSFKSETSLMVAAAGLQEPCALTPSSAASCARAPPLVPEAEACGAPAEAARPRASTKELPCRKDVMDSMAASQATKDPLRFSSEPSRRTTSASSKSTTLPLLQTPKQIRDCAVRQAVSDGLGELRELLEVIRSEQEVLTARVEEALGLGRGADQAPQPDGPRCRLPGLPKPAVQRASTEPQPFSLALVPEWRRGAEPQRGPRNGKGKDVAGGDRVMSFENLDDMYIDFLMKEGRASSRVSTRRKIDLPPE